MSNKFFILLEEFSKKPVAEVGEISKSIAKLVYADVPVPNAVCIPMDTLKMIARINKTDEKAHKLIIETNFSSSFSVDRTITELKKLIHKQRIPQDLVREFLSIYHSDLHSDYVSIQNATIIGNRDVIVDNIKGDVNVVDAFLEVWAKTTEQAFRKYSTKTHITDRVLFPSPILIQQQVSSEMSGVALTFDDRDGSKRRFTIHAVWGLTKNNLSEADKYYVDSRTFQLVDQIQTKQASQYIRSLERLKNQKLGEHKVNSPVLKPQQAEELAKIISKVSKLSLPQLEVEWGMINSRFFIHGIRESDHIIEYKKSDEVQLKKVYASIKGRKTSFDRKNVQGVLFLNSDQLLVSSGKHPGKLSSASDKKHLSNLILKETLKLSDDSSDFHLIYRANDLTSDELSHLKNASQSEVKEVNPHLGLRGASRILAQPNIFQLELEAIKLLLEQTKNRVSLLVPFVRFPSEIARIIKVIEKSGLTKNNNFDVWMELSTPANALSIHEYPLEKLGGVVFNIQSIYSLLSGFDPNDNELLSEQLSHDSLMIAFIKNVSKSIKQTQKSPLNSLKLLINISGYSSGIIQRVVAENIEGVITEPVVTATAKKCIMNEERKLIK